MNGMQVDFSEILRQSKCKGLIRGGMTSTNLSYTVFPYGMRSTFRGIAVLPLISCYQFYFYFCCFNIKRGSWNNIDALLKKKIHSFRMARGHWLRKVWWVLFLFFFFFKLYFRGWIPTG